MTFEQRMHQAAGWEDELVGRLRSLGWMADRFGQGQLNDTWRALLREWADSYGRPTLIRWMPDIIAGRQMPATVYFIDAKKCDGKNYAVEINAVEAAKVYVEQFHAPTLFFFDDMRVLTPDVIENRWHTRMDGAKARGSKTSFYLVDKQFGIPAVKFFPDIRKAA